MGGSAMRRVRLGVWVAAGWGLLGCDAVHIRLLEPIENVTPPEMDAGGTAPEPDIPEPEAGSEAPGAGSSSEDPPEPPNRADSGEPPGVDADAGSPPMPLEDALVLQYDFSGDGEVVHDLVGDRDARLHGGATRSDDLRYIELDGVDGYVDIPNGVVSGLHSATFIVWLAWNGGPCWQRIFDFGVSDQGEDAVGNAATSLFMTPMACGRETFTAMAEIGRVQYPVASDEALRPGSLQVALVVDGDSQTFTLYRDTQLVAEAATSFQLSQLDDVNNWLGRSQWAQDGFFRGTIGEFRIYSRVLSAEEIAQVRAEGFPRPP
jgi:hypothetical protein